jgi:hypothetical protein
MDQVATKVTPMKRSNTYRLDGAALDISSDKDISTAAHHIQTDASLDERKPAFKYSSFDSNTNKEASDNDGNYGDDDGNYGDEEVVEGAEDTQVDEEERGSASDLDENQQDFLINPRLPKPTIMYETIPIYNFSPTQAPRRQAYLLFERLFPNSSLTRSDTMGPLNVPSTELVDGFLRKDFGFLYINGLKKRSHYEIPVADFEGYQSEASL